MEMEQLSWLPKVFHLNRFHCTRQIAPKTILITHMETNTCTQGTSVDSIPEAKGILSSH